jgi:hypothetical protein
LINEYEDDVSTKNVSWIENGNQINKMSMSADENVDVAWSWWRKIKKRIDEPWISQFIEKLFSR